tara:strand:- start:106 stop:594 length:489 start_codon:yes stop_codon:yes gene_type:complete
MSHLPPLDQLDESVLEPAPLSAQFARILAEEREEREYEIEEHRYMIERGQETWEGMMQSPELAIDTVLKRSRRLAYHEQYVYVHLARLAAIAGDDADKGARRQADEWERIVLMRGAARQAQLQSRRGEEPNEIAARVAAREEANAALERIRAKEKNTIYRRR